MVPFLKCIEGYDKSVSMQFVNFWTDRRVTINGISFEINEEVIGRAIGLSLEGRKLCKKTSVLNKASLTKFFFPNEKPAQMHGAS